MITKPFKQYTRNKRQADIETDFSKGMMFTSGAVEEGFVKTLVNYDIANEGRVLKPRSGLRTEELIFSDPVTGYIMPDPSIEELIEEPELTIQEVIVEEEKEDVYLETPVYQNDNEKLLIKDAKECTESNGETYYQFILGDTETETIWVATNKKSNEYLQDIPLKTATSFVVPEGKHCKFFNTPLKQIHGYSLENDSRVAVPVGTFAFGNSYYYIGEGGISRTVFNEGGEYYEIRDVLEPKELVPSEAVSFGYNMLSPNPYEFEDTLEGTTITLEGILPYDSEGKLLMTPKKNTNIKFRCNYRGPGEEFKFIWEWRPIDSSTWNTIKNTDFIDLSELPELAVDFKAPAENIMVRVQAFRKVVNEIPVEGSEEPSLVVTEEFEAGMTVGFDFSVETYGETNNVDPEIYELNSASGMTYWKSRLVLWGVPKDPTILFMSDVNTPEYFPYPNNISIFDEPIVCAKPFMDTLLVFTSSKLYQVVLSEDGNSWNSTVLQSNLRIDEWDRHLIQVVRNMVYFKSGNYYFMIVPKAQSLTGEMVLAPISNNMTEFFNYFSKNVEQVLKETYNYEGVYDFINYYNFLDYEDVHNIYVFRHDDLYIHFDVLYNTNTRAWKIYVFETSTLLFSFKHDATQRGQLASTGLFNLSFEEGSCLLEGDLQAPEHSSEYVRCLELYDVGLDLNNVDDITVEIYTDLDEVVYFSTVLTDWILQSTNYMEISNLFYKLEVEVVDSDINTRLVSLYSTDLPLECRVVLKQGTEVVFESSDMFPNKRTAFEYTFSMPLDYGTKLVFEGEEVVVRAFENGKCEINSDKIRYIERIDVVYNRYNVVFREAVVTPYIKLLKTYTGETLPSRLNRHIQIYSFDSLNIADYFIADKTNIECILDSSGQLDMESIAPNFEDYTTDNLQNWQYLDTGYRNLNLHTYKRFRELQIQLNNIDGVNLDFSMKFTLDGDGRIDYYTYNTEHVVDEANPDYGLIYVEATPRDNIGIRFDTSGETALNHWRLEQDYFPELSLWKVRAPISGKGAAPRLQLVSRNKTRFELTNISWVYRLMNMR